MKAFSNAAVVIALLLPISANAAIITTSFAGGNGADGNMFDILIGPNPVTVTALDLHLSTNQLNLEIFSKTGTYAGSENTSAAWNLEDSTTLTGAGAGSPTFWDIADISFAANTLYSLYITETDTANSGSDFIYSNGTAGAVIAGNSDLTVFGGIGNNYPFGLVFNNRDFNGSIYYEVGSADVPAPATLALIGLGLASLGWKRRSA